MYTVRQGKIPLSPQWGGGGISANVIWGNYEKGNRKKENIREERRNGKE
jgi:hypothetical protein